MWRCDAHRSGATAEDLPRQLWLQWRRRLPPPLVAWPAEPRSQFDACDEPVAAGGRIFVPSSRYGSLSAFDTDSGQRLWQFFADGPVRLAPAVAGGQVFVASDDGYLYCLSAADGTLRWRFRGGPDSRRQLGNEQFISLWPARGGPVVVSDTVYFAAGIWPVLGIFVYAIDVRTGKALWSNRSANDLENLQVDHDFRNTGGIAPQGCLVATAEYLVVPNGRSMPAYLARTDGKLLHYIQGYRAGNCRVAADDDVLVIGNYFYPLRRMVLGDNDRFFMSSQNPGPTPFEAYAFSSQFLFGLQGRTVVCYPIEKIASPAVHETKAAAQPWWKPEFKYAGGFSYQTYQAEKAWSFAFPRETGPPPAAAAPPVAPPKQLIRAGSRLYALVGQSLIAVDLPEHDRSPGVAWTKPLESPACSLLAAAGKLFVVTSDATLLCFSGTAGEPREFADRSAPPLPASGPPAQAAAEIVRHSGVAEGYCLVLGIDSGELALALLQHTKLRLIVVEEEPQQAQRLRDRLIASGYYGPRAQVVVDDPRTIVLPPYLASLIVSERFTIAELLSDPARSRSVLQSLRPFGGVACLPLGAADTGGWRQSVRAAGLGLANPEVAGGWAVVRRPGGPAGSADWLHPCGDAANSLFSRDTAVKPPLTVLWYGDSPTCGFHGPCHHLENAPPVITRGVLAGLDEGGVSASDVYTGRVLWQHRLPVEGGKPAPARIAASDGQIHVACGSRLEILDAVSGTLRLSAADPGEAFQGERPTVRDLFVADGVAISLDAFTKPGAQEPGDIKLLVAWDCRTGSVLWRRPAQFSYSTASKATKSMLACGDGRVFLADTLAPVTRWNMRRRGEKADDPCTLMALVLRTGETLWKETLPHGSAEYLAYCPESGVLLHQRLFSQLRALEGATGKVLWEKPFRTCYVPLMVGPNSFYAIEWYRQIHIAGYAVACNSYDVRTGALVRDSLFRSEDFACNYTHASAFLLTRRDINTYASWIDATSGDICRLGNVRSGCTQSLIPAAGLVVAPNLNYGCGCNYPLQSSYALVPCRSWAGSPATPPKEPASLERSRSSR
jgi:outer membrane protein assembly factor BamB